jgi:D-ribose pyranase
MKKTGVLNAQLARVIASMGHTDKLVICDSGLPIPREADVIDLALTNNIPRFIETLKVVLSELQVEQVIIAEEMTTVSNGMFQQVRDLLRDVTIEQVPHEEFKRIVRDDGTIAFVRTGEMTPYANIILVSGVMFG